MGLGKKAGATKAFVSLDREAEFHLETLRKAGGLRMGWEGGGSFAVLDLRCRQLNFTTK